MREINLGKIHVWIDVARWYYSFIMSTVSGFGILKLLGLTWYALIGLLILLCPILVFIVYLHMTYVFPKKQEYNWMKNPVVKEMLKNAKK